MKKNIFMRSALGFPLGIAIGYLISIGVSLGLGYDTYEPCVPELLLMTGSELNGVILQTVLSGLMGAGFGASSVIWDVERWGLLKQTALYFTASALIMLPIAYGLYWMEHSLWGFVGYLTVFVLIFLIIWAISFFSNKRTVRKMNANLSKAKDADRQE